MGALQPIHLIVVLVIVLIIFGPGKLPQLGKAVGEGIRELKRATVDEPDARIVSTAEPSGPPGAAAVQAVWNCHQCHALVPAADRFCGTCGAPHESPSGAVTSSSAH